MSADAFFQQIWYRKQSSWLSNLLLPLSWLFRAVVAARTFVYSRGIIRQRKVGRPVIVIGNITVGGTGKTPFTIWLARRLRASGFRVGVVLRGYGAKPTSLPYVVQASSTWREAGDEALVIANATHAIVVADPDRVRAAEKAIELGAEVILSDDGLQHLRLGRDYEIAVLDSKRRIGNGRMLPAGPLRESAARLNSVSCRVFMHRDERSDSERANDMANAIDAHAVLGEVQSLTTSESRSLATFSGQRVHAVAGIGNPGAFFAMLRQSGLQVIEHPFADHAALTSEDLDFHDALPVLMTQKDAVRCRAFADERLWAVHMELRIDSQRANALLEAMSRIISARSQTEVTK